MKMHRAFFFLGVVVLIAIAGMLWPTVLSEEARTVEACTAIGGTPGSMYAYRNGELSMIESTPRNATGVLNAPGVVPGFRFGTFKAERAALFPTIRRPFSLDLSYTDVDDAALERVATFSYLTHLNVRGLGKERRERMLGHKSDAERKTSPLNTLPAVTEAGFIALARLERLEHLDLDDEQMTDGLLAALAAAGKVHVVRWAKGADGQRVKSDAEIVTLDLKETPVSIGTLGSVAALPRLTTFAVIRHSLYLLDDAGVATLMAHGKLHWLPTARAADGTEVVADADVRRLTLDGSKVTDSGFAHLARRPGIDRLGLSFTGVTDAGLESVAGLKHLTRLDLSHTKVTDAGLAHVARLTALTHLDLTETKVTDAGLKHLRQMPNLTHLALDHKWVNDETAADLAEIPKLAALYMRRERPTDGLPVALLKSGRVSFRDHWDFTIDDKPNADD